ncbi:NB-ARC domain-containing protein [Streptomyces sp. NPDC001817]|uniref:AfsR/SARP family transcriptional regulator n=1 Tax=Streptomyces sp. NPDC001817 TaxID=3154398 RepID=UPI0033324FBE
MGFIRFDVLGSLQVRCDDTLIQLTGRKYRTVVSHLALQPEYSVAIEDLIRAAWTDKRPSSAHHQVRKMVSALRISLDQDWDLIATSQDGYMLKLSPKQSDVSEFCRLYDQAMSSSLTSDEDLSTAYSALALWRGRPCEGSEPHGQERRISELVEQHRVLLNKTVQGFSNKGRSDELASILHVASKIHGQPVSARSGVTVPAPAARQVGNTHVRETSGSSKPPAPARPGSQFNPRCLPRDLQDFGGREREINELQKLLTKERSHPRLVATIHGMGGVGKTAVAIRVAHRLADHYPDGQLFVSLDGFSSACTASVSNALGVLLRQKGIPDEDISPSEVGRLAQWRTITAGQKLLVVLDDVRNIGQVEPLIPPSNDSACIITSRIILNGIDGAHHISLEVPDEDECLEMLSCMIDKRFDSEETRDARALIQQCANLPLALRLAAARISTRDFLDFRELSDQLSSSDSIFSELEVPGRSLVGRLMTSFTCLEDFDHNRYLRLSLLPCPEIDETSVAATLGVSTDWARRACRRFADRALLQRTRCGTYRMHPLLLHAARLEAEKTITFDEQRRVVRAAFLHYKASNGLVGASRISPSPILDGHVLLRTLTQSAKLATRLGLQKEFIDLCAAWEELLPLLLDTRQQEVVWQLVLAASQQHPDRPTYWGADHEGRSRQEWEMPPEAGGHMDDVTQPCDLGSQPYPGAN